MNFLPKTFTRQLVEFAVSIVAVALLLNWAWNLLQPLVPVIVVVSVLGVLVKLWLARRAW